MDRDLRIRKVGKGEFRSRLSVEDILPGTSDSFFMLTNSFEKTERILTFTKLPIEVPFMDYVFHIKVTDLNDKYLRRYVGDLMFFNEGIDEVGFKKMTGFISRTIVLFNTVI